MEILGSGGGVWVKIQLNKEGVETDGNHTRSNPQEHYRTGYNPTIHGETAMPIIAYKNPVPQEWRSEFEGLDLRRTAQRAIDCSGGCGTQYVLIYPEATEEEKVLQYVEEVHRSMHACGHHPGRMEFRF